MDTPPDGPRCIVCDYVLRGLPDPVCPECGRGFDLADASTYRVGPRISPFCRRLARPPVVLVNVAAVLLAGWTIQAAAWPGRIDLAAPDLFRRAGRYWLLVAAAWVALLLVKSIAVLVGRLPPDARPRGRKRWAFAPVLAAFVWTALAAEWPFKARFALSRPAFDRVAREMLDATPRLDWPDRRIGLFDVKDSACTTMDVSFVMVDPRNGKETLLFYSPDGRFAPLPYYNGLGDGRVEPASEERPDSVAAVVSQGEPLGDGWTLVDTFWISYSPTGPELARRRLVARLADDPPRAAQSIPFLISLLPADDWGGFGHIPAPLGEQSHHHGNRYMQYFCQESFTTLAPTQALASAGEPAIDPLRALVADPASGKQIVAAHTLGLMGPRARRALPEIIALARSSNPSVRARALFAAGTIAPQNRQVWMLLIDSLRDDAEPVRSVVLSMLRQPGVDTALVRRAALRALPGAVWRCWHPRDPGEYGTHQLPNQEFVVRLVKAIRIDPRDVGGWESGIYNRSDVTRHALSACLDVALDSLRSSPPWPWHRRPPPAAAPLE